MAEPAAGNMVIQYLLPLRLEPELMQEHMILQRFQNWLEAQGFPGTEPESLADGDGAAVKYQDRERPEEAWGEPGGRYLPSPPQLDLQQACIIREGRHIPLTPLENSIMTLLYQARGRIVTHRVFEEWAYQTTTGYTCFEPKYHIRQLRSKLGDDLRKPFLITNRRGIGYSLNPQVKAVNDKY